MYWRVRVIFFRPPGIQSMEGVRTCTETVDSIWIVGSLSLTHSLYEISHELWTGGGYFLWAWCISPGDRHPFRAHAE